MFAISKLFVLKSMMKQFDYSKHEHTTHKHQACLTQKNNIQVLVNNSWGKHKENQYHICDKILFKLISPEFLRPIKLMKWVVFEAV